MNGFNQVTGFIESENDVNTISEAAYRLMGFILWYTLVYFGCMEELAQHKAMEEADFQEENTVQVAIPLDTSEKL